MTLPIVFLPALLCDAEMWESQLRLLSARHPIMVAPTTTAEDIDTIAAQVLDVAPRRFALVGLSMGGYVAQAIMRAAPERVDRLALLNTTARADSEEQATRRRDLIALAGRGQFKGVTPRLLPLIVHRDRLDDAALVDRIMAMAERVGQAAFVRQQTAILGRIDARPFLPAIRCPTLVLCGRQDVLTPPELAREMADLIPNARLAIIEDAGHMTPMERPEAVNAHLEAWLAADSQ